MTIINLVCPQCRNKNGYEERNIDTSKEITCSACGFSELPTKFELARGDERTTWQAWKIFIIVLVGIGFLFGGLNRPSISRIFPTNYYYSRDNYYYPSTPLNVENLIECPDFD